MATTNISCLRRHGQLGVRDGEQRAGVERATVFSRFAAEGFCFCGLAFIASILLYKFQMHPDSTQYCAAYHVFDHSDRVSHGTQVLHGKQHSEVGTNNSIKRHTILQQQHCNHSCVNIGETSGESDLKCDRLPGGHRGTSDSLIHFARS